MKAVKIIIPIIIAVALVIGAVKLVKIRKAEEAKMHAALNYPVVVKTITPEYKEGILSLPYLAEVKSSKDVIVNSKFAGRITYVKNLGDHVKQGEIVAKIDANELEAKLKGVDENLNSLRQKLNAENISLKNLIAAHHRTKELLKVKMASIEQYENEQSKIAALKAQIKSTENSIKALNATKNSIMQNLTYAIIKSPVNGTVSAKFLNKNDNTFPGKPILKITSENGTYLFIALPEKKDFIRYKNRLYPLTSLNSTFNGMRAFKADVDDKSLIPGEKVDVDVVEFKGKATFLPYDAILSIDSKNYVFIPEGNKAEVKEVHIISYGKNRVAIKEELNTPVIIAKPDILLKIKAGREIKTENKG